ncbi:MAG: hypothetical protein CMLOHMNK_00252 [Steroidobacteraceae bacterium]|nr:hypothetical protein [Steroidobacteraceae bacterium]
MKYLHLVWAALMRRKTRTVLTILSVLAAFLLFGLLDGVRAAFNAGGTIAGVDRLVVASRFSIIQPLPESLIAQVQSVPGVRRVTWGNWFGGYYQEPKNQLIMFAVAANYFDIYDDYGVTASMRAAFDRSRTGVLVGATIARRFGLKVGDKFPVMGAIYPDKATGEASWQFDVAGIFETPSSKMRAHEQEILMHWKYLDEASAYGSGTVGWLIVQVADPAQSAVVAQRIDDLTKNSDHETKTQTEKAFNLSFAKQIGDIGLIVGAIIGAVFFTLLLLTGNTMAQAVRERIPELATLKTLGFTDRSVLGLVFFESVLLVVIGGVLGLALSSTLIPAVSAASGGMLELPPIGVRTWLIGFALMLAVGAIVGVLPALRAMRLRIVDALAGR